VASDTGGVDQATSSVRRCAAKASAKEMVANRKRARVDRGHKFVSKRRLGILQQRGTSVTAAAIIAQLVEYWFGVVGSVSIVTMRPQAMCAANQSGREAHFQGHSNTKSRRVAWVRCTKNKRVCIN